MATNAVIGRNLLTAPDVHQVVPEYLAGSFVLGKSARTNVCLTLERFQGEDQNTVIAYFTFSLDQR
jgi:hypothetical protein